MGWQNSNGTFNRLIYGICCVVAYITLTLAAPLVLLITWLMVTG